MVFGAAHIYFLFPFGFSYSLSVCVCVCMFVFSFIFIDDQKRTNEPKESSSIVSNHSFDWLCIHNHKNISYNCVYFKFIFIHRCYVYAFPFLSFVSPRFRVYHIALFFQYRVRFKPLLWYYMICVCACVCALAQFISTFFFFNFSSILLLCFCLCLCLDHFS